MRPGLFWFGVIPTERMLGRHRMTGQNGVRMAEPTKRRIPAWLLGLAIAAVVFVAVFILFSALGFGDDPVVDSLGPIWR